ncbi:MAG: FGGY family carbohydrate kinase, partial [bacterium]|nr:FGGY family carbohydrate kinase [bacterium]
EVEYLRDQGVEEVIGRLEPQMALPKLLWALKQHPALKEKIGTVMTTGDFIAMQLTGVPTTSSSDAVSNGLIEQTSRKFADDFICSIHGLKYFWFPPVVQSGSLIPWEKTSEYRSTDWCGVRSLLPGWRFIAGLGNYQAGAVGSGLDGLNTIIISAGTSGTVTRAVKFGTKIAGTPRQFEYFDYTLLLSIMADCASWYDRFVKEFGQGKSHAALDGMIAPYGNVLCLPYPETPDAEFPGWFYQMPLDTQVKTMQHSIAIRLVRHFREIVGALPASEAEHAIERVVLTGGLTRSQYFCKVLRDQLRFEDGFEGKIFVSSRTGPLANQAATLGALINALVGAQTYPTLAVAIKALCPTREI